MKVIFLCEACFIVSLFLKNIHSYEESTFNKENIKYYSNLWVVKIAGGLVKAEEIASNEGFLIVEEVEGFQNLFVFLNPKHPTREKYRNVQVDKKLLAYNEILWLQQLATKKLQINDESKFAPIKSLLSYRKRNFLLAYSGLLNDPLFYRQWYLGDYGRVNNTKKFQGMNIIPVWLKYKIFGRQIKVVIVDDGLQMLNKDLKDNYNLNYGLDLIDGDNFPMPAGPNWTHGTKIAGVVAMRAGNRFCGVGVAPLATLGAVKIFNEEMQVTESTLSKALSFKVAEIDIINCSWGKIDDGKSTGRLTPWTMSAIRKGILEGRRGKGLIYVFSSGNGRLLGDTCAYDGRKNNMYTITIASAQYNGSPSMTSESCSSILGTAYGRGDVLEPGSHIVTTCGYECTNNFGGTSAAAAITSGVLALVLEANNNLSWRTVQHLFPWTCEVASLDQNEGWERNAAGFYYHHDFGFGMINALKMVDFAKTLKESDIPAMSTCFIPIHLKGTNTLKQSQALRIEVLVNACQGLPSEIKYLEHVQLLLDFKYSNLGAIEIYLRSPTGTESHILASREKDTASGTVADLVIDTVHMWGEAPQGIWKILFKDKTKNRNNTGLILRIGILLHGTKEKPHHYRETRTYYPFQLANFTRTKRDLDPMWM